MTGPVSVLRPSGKYRDLIEIGRGGMGEVCLAIAQGAAGFKKLVVLKRARADMVGEPEVLAMFLDEARIAARLNHPNVVQTYEAGEEGGRYHIAMEYLEGQSLHQVHVRVGAVNFPLAMQIRVLVEALSGLHYAHELHDFDGKPLGMVHRDATPQNIFVTYDGQIKVVDFGMAKAASSMNKTRLGMLKGKVTYMACEQARLEPLDRRTDIFAVGIMLWEALAGHRMWKGVGDATIIRRLAAGDLPPMPATPLHHDAELERICKKALSPKPADRFATAAEMQADLERWLKANGDEITARSVGRFVAEHFADDRTAFKARIEQALAGGDPASSNEGPAIETEVSSERPSIEQGTLGQASVSVDRAVVDQTEAPWAAPTPPKRSRTPLWIGVAGAAILAAGVIAGAMRARGPSGAPADSALATAPQPSASADAPSPSPSAAAPAANSAASTAASAAPVGSISLAVGVKPSIAKIFLDGEPIGTGFYKGKLPKDGREHRLRIEAPGYTPVEQPISATGSLIFNLTLDKETAAPK